VDKRGWKECYLYASDVQQKINMERIGKRVFAPLGGDYFTLYPVLRWLFFQHRRKLRVVALRDVRGLVGFVNLEF